METCLALLRAINVGGKNKVNMAQLKYIFEKSGFVNVRTYINSGNVLFDVDILENNELISKEIEDILKKSFGFEIRLIVVQASKIIKIIENIPEEWQNNDKQKTDVFFLWPTYANKQSLKLIKTNPEIDRLIYIGQTIVWNIERKDYNKSGMHKIIGTDIYKNSTIRNINTLRKLANLIKGQVDRAT